MDPEHPNQDLQPIHTKDQNNHYWPFMFFLFFFRPSEKKKMNC
jgi:hypothetical protein